MRSSTTSSRPRSATGPAGSVNWETPWPSTESGAFLSRYPPNQCSIRCLVAVKELLSEAGVEYEHFEGVEPNPTTDCVTAGADMAKRFDADVILGVVGAQVWTGKGHRRGGEPSGHGLGLSLVPGYATQRRHPAYHRGIHYFRHGAPSSPRSPYSPTAGAEQIGYLQQTAMSIRAGIVDPELMVTVPAHVTASTGFDVFTHAFESYLHVNASPYTDSMALEAIRLVAENLPTAVSDGSDMAGAVRQWHGPTSGGLCIANAGVTLPHGIGMTIGGYCPHVMHGEALAVTYPEFTRFTYEYAAERFATGGS